MKRKLTKVQLRRIKKLKEKRLEKSSASQAEHLKTYQQATLSEKKSGLIIKSYGVHQCVEDSSGQRFTCVARQNMGQLLCGDQVIWQQANASQGIILGHQERKTILRQNNNKLIAANLSQILIVISCHPKLLFHTLDSYILAAEKAKIPSHIIITKYDKISEDDRNRIQNVLLFYQKMQYNIIFTSILDGTGLTPLKRLLCDQLSILIGPSGAGKSSLLKSILPEEDIRIGETSSSGSGKHTTTTSTLYHLPQGGQLIDSPGIRKFNPTHLNKNDITYQFKDFQTFLGHCRFNNCQHTNEPHCAILNAVKNGEIAIERLQSYYQFISEASN